MFSSMSEAEMREVSVGRGGGSRFGDSNVDLAVSAALGAEWVEGIEVLLRGLDSMPPFDHGWPFSFAIPWSRARGL